MKKLRLREAARDFHPRSTWCQSLHSCHQITEHVPYHSSNEHVAEPGQVLLSVVHSCYLESSDLPLMGGG